MIKANLYLYRTVEGGPNESVRFTARSVGA